ncbi:MAG: protein kinase [Deltaproteobacteria bacterium]|nr:protein kinase [Deltaproteobacteria bacterium]
MPNPNANRGLRPFSPTRFGRYTLLAPLATGGMAQVYLARVAGVEGFEKLVVIKKILPHLAADEDFVERFLDEGKIVVMLHHGSIAQVIDMGKEGEEYYLAMEFVDGKDLRKVAARCRDQNALLPTGLALHIFVRLLDALAYAHRKKDDKDRELSVVHRDISPQNILVSYEGEVKIIDFGLAKSALSLRRTSPSMILGKFFYMSPEQARHQPADRRSDLYATGICLWELLVGRNPFDDTPPGEILRVIANPQITPLRDLCPDLPESLNAVVMKALAPDPAQRFQTAEEMRGRLMTCMLEADPSAGPEALASFMRERFEREYDNERKTIALLSKLPTPSETKAPQSGDEDDGEARATIIDRSAQEAALPALDAPSEQLTASSPTLEALAFDSPNTDRDLTAAGPAPASIKGPAPDVTTPRTQGPIYGGAAETPAHNRSLASKRRAHGSPDDEGEEEVDERRLTIKMDPLEFIPGIEGGARPASPRREPTDPRRKAVKASEAAIGHQRTARPARPRPGRPTSREKSAVVQPARRAPTPGGLPPGLATHPEATTPPSIIVASGFQDSGEPEESVLVSPQLLAEPADEPAAPGSASDEIASTPSVGTPAFTADNETQRGIEVDARRGIATTVWVFIGVGLAFLVAAAITGMVVFRPASLETKTNPESDVAAPPAIERSSAGADSAPTAALAAHRAADSASPPSKATEEIQTDRSVLKAQPRGPYGKARFRKAELERLFPELKAWFDRLRSRYPTSQIAGLAGAFQRVSEKHELLSDPQHHAEVEQWLLWFQDGLKATERNLKKP